MRLRFAELLQGRAEALVAELLATTLEKIDMVYGE